MAPLQFAVFASGRGSNFFAIQQNIDSGQIRGEVACVISNSDSAPVLKKARSLGIETFDISPVKLKATHDYVSELNTVLTGHSIDYILLAGYMKKIPAAIVQEYRNRIVNIHPALLPSFGGKGFYGMRVHDAVIERGVKWSGVTVHFVDEIYDHGPIIFQYPVRVYDDDTAETLAGRVLDIEHKAYPKVVRWLCQGWITVKGNKTIFTGPEEEWGI